MNKTMIFCMMLIYSLPFQAKPGCMDNSYHLKQKFDPKEYHLVTCNCPCDYYSSQGLRIAKRDICLECGHAHNPGPNPYVPQKGKASPASARINLAHVISKYRKN